MIDIDELERLINAHKMPGSPVSGATALALIAEVRALREDKKRLDSGCIVRTDWDDWGDVIKIESRGNDLRKMIDEAMAIADRESR